MRAWVSPPNASSSPTATTLRMSTPEVNASLSPRNANCRGMKPSWARIAPSLGKALYDVFAARKRISAVNVWNR